MTEPRFLGQLRSRVFWSFGAGTNFLRLLTAASFWKGKKKSFVHILVSGAGVDTLIRSRSRLRALGIPEPHKKVAAPQHSTEQFNIFVEAPGLDPDPKNIANI